MFPSRHPSTFYNTPPFRGNQGFFQPYQPPVRPSSISISTMAAKGMGGLSKTLTNVQQVLQVVQSAAPIVQQYGPMVKNIPMMYHMFKAFKEMDNETEEGEEQSASVDLNETEPLEDIAEQTTLTENPEYKNGKSKPKLFI